MNTITSTIELPMQLSSFPFEFNEDEKEFLKFFLPQLNIYTHKACGGDFNREEILEMMGDQFGTPGISCGNEAIDSLIEKEVLFENPIMTGALGEIRESVISLHESLYDMHTDFLNTFIKMEVSDYANLNVTGAYMENKEGKLIRTFYIGRAGCKENNFETINGKMKSILSCDYDWVDDYTLKSFHKFVSGTLTETFNIVVFDLINKTEKHFLDFKLTNRMSNGMPYGKSYYSGNTFYGSDSLHINL